MAHGPNPVDEAFDRISLVKRIVAIERSRAEREPHGARNLEHGIVDPRWPRDRVAGEIARTFNDLELFLDHLLVLAMAAAFEHAARNRIGHAAGAARAAIQKGRRPEDRWPAKLVRDAGSFDGLRDIGDLLGLDSDLLRFFRQIRSVRNGLSHGDPVRGVPEITAEDARTTLTFALDRLKGRD